MSKVKRSGRLGTQMRGRLADAYEKRGHARAQLWYAYSPRAKRDVAFTGDLEFGHFLLVESDPRVRCVDYAPKERVARIAGSAMAHVTDAEVILSDGTTEWREVKRSTDSRVAQEAVASLQFMAREQGAARAPRHVLMTEREIYACPQRTMNWMRIVPWLAQARYFSLHWHRAQVASLLLGRGQIDFGEVLALARNVHSDTEAALYGAAVFDAVREGEVLSDLDQRPLSLATRFWIPGRLA